MLQGPTINIPAETKEHMAHNGNHPQRIIHWRRSSIKAGGKNRKSEAAYVIECKYYVCAATLSKETWVQTFLSQMCWTWDKHESDGAQTLPTVGTSPYKIRNVIQTGRRMYRIGTNILLRKVIALQTARKKLSMHRRTRKERNATGGCEAVIFFNLLIILSFFPLGAKVCMHTGSGGSRSLYNCMHTG